MIDSKVLKVRAFLRHLIETRGFAKGAAVNPEVTVAPVIGKDKDDIGLLRLSKGSLGWHIRHTTHCGQRLQSKNSTKQSDAPRFLFTDSCHNPFQVGAL